MESTLTGTKLKLAVRLACDGLSMDEMDFTCRFFTSPSRVVEVRKCDMDRMDSESYMARVDTRGMASGELLMRVDALVPDGDEEDGVREESVRIGTGVVLRRS